MARFQRIFFLPLIASLFGLMAASCGDEPSAKLRILVRTDLVAGYEFNGALIEVEQPGADPVSERTGAPRNESWRTGYEVTSLRRIPAGQTTVRVTLQDAARNPVLSRVITLEYGGNSADLTFVLSRNCLGVSCGDGESCQAGECASSACHPGAPESCPAPQCTSASSCPNNEYACAISECAEGVCFLGALTRDECSELGTCCATGEWCNPTAGCTALPDGPEAGIPDAGMMADSGPDMTVPTDGSVDMMPDAPPCVNDVACTPTGYEYACYTAGKINCALGGVCVGRADSARDTGSPCGFMNSRVCNAAKECVDCYGDGEACVIPGSCQLGTISRADGCACVPNSSGEFLDPGELCASGTPNRYCTTGGSCVQCTGEGSSCGANSGIRGCIRSRLTCATETFSGVAECLDDPTFRPAGSICAINPGSDGLCSGASPVCEGCEDDLACLVSGATGNAACVRGLTVCNTGMGGGIECDATGSTDFVAPGETCGNNQVCTPSGTCIGCTQGAACNTDRKCSVSTVDCSAGAVDCQLDESVGAGGIVESGAPGRPSAAAADQCSTTETCNGISEDCQSVMSNVASVAVGPNHSCAIAAESAAALSRGETYAACWGANFRSSIGVGVVSNCNVGRAARVDLCNDDTTVAGTLCRSSVSGPKEIAVGHSTSCLIDSEGAVFCWGNNLNGEVGGPSGTLDGDGIAYRACSGAAGALPLQERACVETAARKVRLPAGQKAVQVAISQTAPKNCEMGFSNSLVCDPNGPEYRQVCAVTEAGKLYCWGGVAASGASEVLMSVMRPSMSSAPEFYVTGSAAVDWRFEQVAIGNGFWCTLVRDRSTVSATRGQTRVLCSGEFANGQRGDGLTVEDRGAETPRFPPMVGTVRAVVGLSDAVDISASSDFACAVRAAGATTGGQGRVVCWGALAGRSVDMSEIGGGTAVRKPVYVRALAGVPLRYIDASGTIPTPESGLLITGATDISTGPQTSCVRLSTGRLRCWGSSYLGIGTVNTSTYGLLQETQPTREINPGARLSTMSNVATTAFSIGYHTDDVPARSGTVGCYIRDYSRRQLFCWGSNGTRQLGHCISTQGQARLTPVPVLPFDSTLNGICRVGDSLMAPSTCVQTEPVD